MISVSNRWAVIGLVVCVSGCASFSSRRGIDETSALVEARGGAALSDRGPHDCDDPRSGVAEFVASPLTVEVAVQIALLCNPELAAEYARLGIANAEAFEAVRLANPSLHLGYADSNGEGGGSQLNLGIAQNFTRLILRGPRTRLADGEFLRAQQLLAGSVLNLAADVKSAYHQWVGAQQISAARKAIADAESVSADLAAGFHVAGNISARELALAQAGAAQARVARRLADDTVASARAALQRRLGIAGFASVIVADVIGGPVEREEDLADLRTLADAQRLDLAATRTLVGLLADSAMTTRSLRWLGDFEVGIDYEREPDRSRLLGPTLSIELPLFNRGQGRVARADSLHAWSEAERRRLTLEVGSAVDLASQQVRSARARIDDHREQLLPRRAEVVARTQEEVNFMLRGVFELIEARVAEFEAAQGYFEALRDYWIARSELERAVGAQLPAVSTGSISVADVLRSTPAAGDQTPTDHADMDHATMKHGAVAPPSTPIEPPPTDHRHHHNDHDHEQQGEQP